MIVVETRELSVAAHRQGSWTRVVEDVDLAVSAGEIVGLVGETGAGKTLTTRALIGLLPRGVRAQGHVTLGDREYDAGDERSARAGLGRDAGMVLQNPATALNPLSRVRGQLVEGVRHLGLLSRADADLRARSLLSQLGFDDPDRVLELHPHQLSGGMAQRVSIAAALMPGPKLLVVDEPTSALDAHVRVEVLRLVRAIAHESRTAVLLVSHDLALVGGFCDRVNVMYAGRIVETGPTGAVLADPQHPYTEALRACAITTEAVGRERLATIPGVPPAPEAWPSGCVFEPRCHLAFDDCRRIRPPLADVAEARTSACLLAGSLPVDRSKRVGMGHHA